MDKTQNEICTLDQDTGLRCYLVQLFRQAKQKMAEVLDLRVAPNIRGEAEEAPPDPVQVPNVMQAEVPVPNFKDAEIQAAFEQLRTYCMELRTQLCEQQMETQLREQRMETQLRELRTQLCEQRRTKRRYFVAAGISVVVALIEFMVIVGWIIISLSSS